MYSQLNFLDCTSSVQPTNFPYTSDVRQTSEPNEPHTIRPKKYKKNIRDAAASLSPLQPWTTTDPGREGERSGTQAPPPAIILPTDRIREIQSREDGSGDRLGEHTVQTKKGPRQKYYLINKGRWYVENYIVGGEQASHPIKNEEDINNMINWLYGHAHPRYVVMFVLGLNLGLRVNEICKLKVKDLYHDDGSVRYLTDVMDSSDAIVVNQSKQHGKKRKVNLNDICADVLRWYWGWVAHLSGEDFLFSSHTSTSAPIHPNSVLKTLQRAADACNVKCKVGTHSMRKSFGYHHFKANGDVVFIQELFGHGDPLITMRYIGIMDEDRKQAYHSVRLGSPPWVEDQVNTK